MISLGDDRAEGLGVLVKPCTKEKEPHALTAQPPDLVAKPLQQNRTASIT